MSNFCPEWVFSICSANAAIEFLSQDTSIESCAKKYSVGLSANYAPVDPDQIALSAQELLLFLSGGGVMLRQDGWGKNRYF